LGFYLDFIAFLFGFYFRHYFQSIEIIE